MSLIPNYDTQPHDRTPIEFWIGLSLRLLGFLLITYAIWMILRIVCESFSFLLGSPPMQQVGFRSFDIDLIRMVFAAAVYSAPSALLGAALFSFHDRLAAVLMPRK